jgi:chemosensory pili system protein ChpA (sensor histidine kinase/response regulator)
MSTLSKVDPSTLGWVKTEIDETLTQARLALEAYSENPSDDSKLRFCATYLHQVLGTLQMVELDGAAMLAREIEALAEAVLHTEQIAQGPAIEVLIRGILTLPDYLGRLQAGQPDAPLRNLQLLNELRAQRGSEPFNELDLFQPDFDVRPPKREGVVKPTDAEFAATARALRPAFQATLLNWLRDASSRQQLTELAGMLERLQQEASLPLLEQLFWVAGGYLDALASGALELNNDRKKLLARLEQQLKKIAESNDRSLIRNTSEALIKAMLYETGHAKAASGRAAEIRRAFALDELLPGAGGEYDLPAPEVLQSVSEAFGKEIEQAQDLLATYFEQGDDAALESLTVLLRKMTGTLDMLNIDLLKIMVEELVGVCEALAAGELVKSESMSMNMAGSLLFLEHSARNIQSLGASWKGHAEDAIARLRTLRAGETVTDVSGIEITDASLSDSEFKQLVAAVGGEIRVNLGKIEEALETFAANTAQVEQLESVPHSLSQIQGALQILGQQRASELVANTLLVIQDLRDRKTSADSAILDALAVAVGTIGAYIEGLERDRPNLESLLVNARTDLAAAVTGKRPHSGDPDALINSVETNLTAWLADPNDSESLGVLQQDLRDVAWLAGTQKHERIGKICEQMVSLLDMVESGEMMSEVADTLRQSCEALATLTRSQLKVQQRAQTELRTPPQAKVVAAPSASARAAPATSPAVQDDEHDDIVLIFIEDALEMIALINKTLPDWHADPSNRNALLDLRRAFHTLKGSGRMVGASDISEFAWAVENMLNKVREGKIEHTEAMFDLLYRARDALPELVAQLEGGPAPQVDVLALRAMAEALAENRPVELPAAAPVAPAVENRPVVADTEPHPEHATDELPVLDATLLQIFTNETRGHLATVRTEIERCQADTLGNQIPASLARAVHTLQGSARAVGLKPMAEASAELERMLHAYQTHQLPLDDAAAALFNQLTDVVGELVDALNQGGTQVDRQVHALALLAQRAHDIHAHVGVAEVAAAPPKPAIAQTQIAEPAASAPMHAEPQVSPAPSPVTAVSAPPTPVASALAAPSVAKPLAGNEVIQEKLDPELLEIFLEEAVDILAAIEESLTSWRGNRANKAAVAELKRQLHTLKGGARMAGAMTMGNLGHHTESLLGEIETGRISADADLMDLMDEVHDALAAMVEQMQSNKPVMAFSQLNNRLLARLGLPPVALASAASTPATVPAAPAVAPTAPSAPPPAAGYPEHVAAPAWVAAPPELAAAEHAAEEHIDQRTEHEEPSEGMVAADRRGQIRVRTSLLNQLVNFAGEVSISRSRMEQQIFGVRENLVELNRNVSRFREQIRDLEIQSESQILARTQEVASQAGEDFDPLEFDRFSRLQTLSRSLAETLHDLFTIRSNLDNYASQAEVVLSQQARINTDLQEGLMRTRMIGFATQSARLRHIVRQTAREVGKRVELELVGGDVEVDRTVLERMIGPFEHMIRNSIDHGIEPEAERRQAGKPPTGKITISASNEGTEAVIRFMDDGAGLDIGAIRRKATERGLIKTGVNLSDDELIQFILMAGFSTAGKVTQLSGRGVGMDVVHNEVKQLGGSITVDTRRGAGTTFIVRLPLTLSIAQALMVRAGEDVFAVPISSVANILEVPIESLNSIRVGSKPLLNWQDQVYPFMNLAVRLGTTPQATTSRKVPVLLARSGGRQVAIQVDGLAGTREIVIKPLSPQLAGIDGLSGATILGDGRVVLILDIPGLWLTEEGMHVAHPPRIPEGTTTYSDAEAEVDVPSSISMEEEVAPVSLDDVATPVSMDEEVVAVSLDEEIAPVAEPPVAATRSRALIMVVDDSITVRKVTQRHLLKQGMEVLLAKDGQDAVEQLRENLPDVMLVDIEMPRMDGYELTTHVRSDARLKDIPIIMITSRSGDKHRDKAMALGVNLYMTKPYQEEHLLRNINRLLPEHLKSS